MSSGDLNRVANPGSGNVLRELLDQFRFPGCPHVVEQTGPLLQPGPGDDPLELRSQIAAIPADFAIAAWR